MKKDKFNKFLNNTAAQRAIATSGAGVCCYRVGDDMPLEQRGWFCNENLNSHYECQPNSEHLPRGTDWTEWHKNTTCRANPCQLSTLNGSCCVGPKSSGLLDLPAGCYDSRNRVPNPSGGEPLAHPNQNSCNHAVMDGQWRSYQYCDKPCMQMQSRPRAENMDI